MKKQDYKEFKKRLKVLCEYKLTPMEDNELDAESTALLDEDPEEPGEEQPAEAPAQEPAPAAEPAPQEVESPDQPPVQEPKQEPAPMVPPKVEDAPAEQPEDDMISQKMDQMTQSVQMLTQQLQQIMQSSAAQQQAQQAEIQSLQKQVDDVTPPTPEEEYDLISKKSHPYHLKLSDVWNDYYQDEPVQQQGPVSMSAEDAEDSFDDNTLRQSLR